MVFLNPRYLSDAFEMMDSRELKICAGLTHLLRFYRRFPEELEMRPSALMHIGRLDALRECREEYKRYVIGATTTVSDLEHDPMILKYCPAIAVAAQATSTPQIRNRRTLGGEVAWGAYHSPLIVTLMALEAELRIRYRGEKGGQGREEFMSLESFYTGEKTRLAADGKKLVCREAKTSSRDLLMKISLSEDVLKRPGAFNFFRSLTPKISTENSGIVLAVSGVQHNGSILEAQVAASGLWLWPWKMKLPLEGLKLQEHFIYERLYSFCERVSFEKFRREGPSAPQMGSIIFGLLKEGFGQYMGR